jgi:GTP cyclohydrolase I
MKKDPELGKKVHDHLVALGIETPMTERVLTPNEQIELIEPHIEAVLKLLNLDVTDDSLEKTSHRVSKMYVQEVFSGLNYDNFPKCSVFENKMSCPDEYIAVHNIETKSFCEHHLLPIINRNGGGIHVAYIPNKTVIGTSKINRVVSFFGRRPQVQERLNHQILEALKYILETDNVAVVINANHMCVELRGVEDTSSFMATCAMSGKFLTDVQIRQEFLSTCK